MMFAIDIKLSYINIKSEREKNLEISLFVFNWIFEVFFLFSKTVPGKIVTMIYAIFGIPLMLLCLANIGSTMADAFRFIYCNICCSYCHLVKKRRNLRALQSIELPPSSPTTPTAPVGTAATTTSSNTLQLPSNNLEQPPATNVVEFVDNLSVDYRKVTIPISVTLSLLSSYLILGAVLFSEWENWKFLDGAYFCFVTLATIGLGTNSSTRITDDRFLSLSLSCRRSCPR